ncbi:LysM peptidoglycan-binding domain-containing protein [Asanoa sp. WMMD1127]|uniref:LysM peptidoglycan-binding domain-containing protein n=1 Tax=Asanoa sp. WMMD1127 TaxID=3016107 RepID=UPI002417695C|nr:LysM peptidoglycan-binding domain-containing protein [Asanoa sp. WMMD1127]MDG4823739.1 LysM peptidoglycan-binding domain-containing protein [Asanoa sp. WMMD1127]
MSVVGISGSPAAVLRRLPVRRTKPRLRLTRRGRLVLVVLFLLAVGGLAAILSPASRAADPAGPPAVAVVQPGDTLWSVVERHRPGNAPFAVIDEVRRLNNLDDFTVFAGQHLILPAE